MAAKNSCEGGCSGNCKHSPSNPYAKSTQAVWHEPTEYDALQHGPSYLPKRSLTASEKATVRAFTKKAAFDVPLDIPSEVSGLDPVWKPVFVLLGVLRAASFIHQTHHWMTKGPAFYADHQLFDRLYEESSQSIDQVAERIVGSSSIGVGALGQAWVLKSAVEFCCGSKETPVHANGMVAASLMMEVGVLKSLQIAKASLDRAGLLTPGTSNLLDGVYDIHETFVYLLQQRSESYTYDRS